MGTREGIQSLDEIASVGIAAEDAMNRLQSSGTTEETSTFDVDGRTFEVTVRRIAFNGLLGDCGCTSRTIESARACKCDACTRWWCDNVPGYFYCPACHRAVTPLDDQHDGVCEQCFDACLAEWSDECGQKLRQN